MEERKRQLHGILQTYGRATLVNYVKFVADDTYPAQLQGVTHLRPTGAAAAEARGNTNNPYAFASQSGKKPAGAAQR